MHGLLSVRDLGYQRRARTCSYLSSPCSSTITSLVIFAGGSASSSCGNGQDLARVDEVGLRTRLGLGRGRRLTLSVNSWPIFLEWVCA